MNEGREEKVYEEIGTAAGATEDGQEIVGLLFPTGIGDETEDVFMTLPCAKSLLIDLQDAIQACMEHKGK